METRRFCVYNQASECFLSLGVIAAESMMAQLKTFVGRHTERYDEGLWVTLSSGFRSLRLGTPAPLDLIYLDRDCRVVRLVESFHHFRVAPASPGATSVLALPAHTIYSSQTQVGHQLVICVAEELAFQLGITPRLGPPLLSVDPARNAHDVNWLAGYLSLGSAQESAQSRRRARRQIWPRLVARDCDGAELAVYGIRDASATGLYLLTEKRWPLGARVWMTLQRTDGAEQGAESSITVQMEVTRWGADGVGLAFVLPESPEDAHELESDRAAGELEEPPVAAEKSGFVN